jgi:adenosylhomocysteine nucleosidase
MPALQKIEMLTPPIRRLFLIGAILVFALGSQTLIGASPVDFLLAAATDAELRPLIAKLQDSHTESRAAWQFWLGTLEGKQVVLTRTEGDPLNAVAATTLAIRRYSPKLVVTFGSARAHDPTLRAGDLVVSGKFAAFDGMYSAVTPLEGGSHPLSWERLPHLLATTGEKETPAYFFSADARALDVAKELTSRRGKVVVGVLGSAPQINREADRIAWIRSQWNTSSEDGESAHIAGCAQLLGVPVIGLRVIDGEDDEVAAVALNFLEAWK